MSTEEETVKPARRSPWHLIQIVIVLLLLWTASTGPVLRVGMYAFEAGYISEDTWELIIDIYGLPVSLLCNTPLRPLIESYLKLWLP